MHSIFVGESFCGKSTAMRRAAARAKLSGRKVFSWLRNEEKGIWDKQVGLDYSTDNGEEFLKYLKCNWNVTFSVEDAQDLIGRSKPEMRWLTSDSRHLGHHALLGTQSLTGLDPKIVNNVKYVYGFFSVKENAEMLARRYNCPEFLECPDLPKGTCIYYNRDAREVAKIKFFTPTDDAKTLVS